jgi:hypothetical protein
MARRSPFGRREASYSLSLAFAIPQARPTNPKGMKSDGIFLLTTIKETLPEHRRGYFDESLKEQETEKNSWKDIAETVDPLLGKAISNTMTLGIGWVIHTLLM